MIIVTAFGVVLGTLVLQGLTLRPLIVRLHLRDDGTVNREVHFARVETLRAAILAVEAFPGAETAALVRYCYRFQLRRAEQGLASDSANTNNNTAEHTAAAPAAPANTSGQEADALVIRAVTEAQRQRLVALRANDTIGDAAFQRVEEELDWGELNWA